jgi:hypothetical protein
MTETIDRKLNQMIPGARVFARGDADDLGTVVAGKHGEPWVIWDSGEHDALTGCQCDIGCQCFGDVQTSFGIKVIPTSEDP